LKKQGEEIPHNREMNCHPIGHKNSLSGPSTKNLLDRLLPRSVIRRRCVTDDAGEKMCQL
jgi:hypothetical protein